MMGPRVACYSVLINVELLSSYCFIYKIDVVNFQDLLASYTSYVFDLQSKFHTCGTTCTLDMACITRSLSCFEAASKPKSSSQAGLSCRTAPANPVRIAHRPHMIALSWVLVPRVNSSTCAKLC